MPNKAISGKNVIALRKEFVAGATLDELMIRYSISRDKARALTVGYTRLSDGNPLMPASYRHDTISPKNRPLSTVVRLTINVVLVVSPGIFLDDNVRQNLSKEMDSLITLAGAEPVAASCHPQYLIAIIRLRPAVSLDDFVARLRSGVIEYLESIGVPDAIWLNGYHATSSGDPYASEVKRYVDNMRAFKW
jgi:hypothetical protein